MEYFDLYNKDGQKLNKNVLRGTKLKEDEYHIVVNVWIKNKENNYLIQQRNKLTDKHPFMWAATDGSAVAGDSSIITALKETHEELGISLKEDKLKFLRRYVVKDNYANFILDVYLTKVELLLKDLKIDPVEVKAVKYSSMKDIEEEVTNKTFKDYERIIKQEGYFDLIEES